MYFLLFSSDVPKLSMLSGRKRLEQILKTKRIQQNPIKASKPKENLTSNTSLTVSMKASTPTFKWNNRVKVGICNNSIIPPVIRGFNGPFDYNGLKQTLLQNGGSDSFIQQQGDTYRRNSDFVFYACDDNKVLDVFTNRRYFRLPCDSSVLRPGISTARWPDCKTPTHCVGMPASRYEDSK